MCSEIHADYTQSFLLPPSPSDWVKDDDPAHFIRDFVESVDLKALGFHGRISPDGRPSYAPDLLLKIWLYGYWENIRSSRALERACRVQMPLIWLAGMHTPDHNTLWRFWSVNRVAIAQLFKAHVRVAVKSGEVGMVLHALDGSKIHSAASRGSAWHKEDLEHLFTRVNAFISSLEDVINREPQANEQSYVLSDKLKNATARRDAIKSALDELAREGAAHFHPNDRDARLMAGPSGTSWAYNAQAVVDDQSGLIVATGVSGQANDRAHLVPMLDAVADNAGTPATTTVADSGYHSGVQFKAAEEKGYGVLVFGKDSGRGCDSAYHISKFKYDAANDTFTCPQGHTLAYKSAFFSKSHGHDLRRYTTTACATCPVRDQCGGNKKRRIIEKSPYYEATSNHDKRRELPESQALLKKRMPIIERVFAQIKATMGLRRFTARGLNNAVAQWNAVCLTYNLRKQHRKKFALQEGTPKRRHVQLGIQARRSKFKAKQTETCIVQTG